MKKIFTLMTLACMTIGAQAQGKFALEAGQGEIAAGTQITSVPNITLTFGVAGEAAFADPSADESVEGYTAYTKGNGVNGSEDAGTQYILTPAQDGSITVAVVLNASKKFFITENGTALDAYNAITVEEKYYGTYDFKVKGGSTYKVYCTGSKLGFYGFEYTIGGDTPEPPVQEGDSYKPISVAEDGTIALAPEFAAIVDADGNATNVVDGKSVITITTDNMTLEAVGGATIANKEGGNQDLEPGEVIDEENHIYEIASVNAWNPITWKNGNNKLDINDADQTKLYFLMGSGNPYVAMNCEEVYTDGTPTGNYRASYTYYKPGMETMPLVGLYYKFTPKADGLLKVQVWANKGNRNTYVINDQTKEAVKYAAEGYVNGQRANYDTPAIDPETGEPKLDNQGNPVYEQYQIFFNAEEIQERHNAAKVNEEGVDTAPFVIDAGNQAFWGWISFDVKAGTSYWLFQDSSQVGFGGFEFTAGASGISEVANAMPAASGQLFNLRGQKVDESYKGIVVKNGRKLYNR